MKIIREKSLDRFFFFPLSAQLNKVFFETVFIFIFILIQAIV